MTVNEMMKQQRPYMALGTLMYSGISIKGILIYDEWSWCFYEDAMALPKDDPAYLNPQDLKMYLQDYPHLMEVLFSNQQNSNNSESSQSSLKTNRPRYKSKESKFI
jgi:hypothetical protein